MTFERFYLLSSYALVVTAFYAFIATRQLDPVTIVLFGGVLVTAWLIDREKIKWSLSRRAANWVILFYTPIAVLEWKFLAFSHARVIVHFVLFASALKLLRRKTSRDWLWLYVVSFCQVIMAAGMIVGPKFLVLLVVYLFTAILTLIGFEIRRSQMAYAGAAIARMQPRPVEIEFRRRLAASRWRPVKPRWRSLVFFSIMVLAVVFALAIPIFLTMPRLNRGASRNGILATESLSGFSDSVRLGEVAQVKLNPEVVMRVRVRFPRGMPPRALRWRGVTLDYYDGRNWIESGTRTLAMRKTENAFAIDRRLSEFGVTEQRFFLEPLNINTIFAAHRPIFVVGLGILSRDQGDGLWTEPHPNHKLDYRVYSDTHHPSVEELMADNSRVYPAEIKQRYWQLPLNHDQRINQLVAEVTRGARTQYEAAARIEEYLRTTFGYTLNLRRVEEGDPVADFLFNVREGHCEYFASAMVLMLRTRRIPARLVNGFQMGEYNESADFYTVRQSDAHSWVEVYFPNEGWVAFDPTPSAGLSVYGSGWLATLRRYSEALEMFWLEQVVGFDTAKQISMAIALRRWLMAYQRDSSSRWSDWMIEIGQRAEAWRESGYGLRFEPGSDESARLTKWLQSAVTHPATLGILACLGALAAVLLWRRQARAWQWRLKKDAAHSAVVFYQEMLRLLERRGYRREPAQTPTEFAALVPLPGVAEITNLYQRTRFGRHSLAPDEVRMIGSYLKSLGKKRSLKHNTASWPPPN